MNFVLQILKSSYFSILILFFCNLAINANEITAKRIMSLSPSITEILFAIGSENQVIAVDSLSNLYPHRAYVFVHYSHPPLLERLEKLKG